MFRNKNIKLILNYVLGPLVFVLLLSSIYRQIQQQPDWRQSLRHISVSWRNAPLWEEIAVFLLMFCNWGLEAVKWRWALSRLVPVSFFRAFQAVFTGTTLAFFTPNRMGEYVGRILYIGEEYRIQAISLTLVCSLAQLLVTLLAGCGGLLLIRSQMVELSGGTAGNAFWVNLLFFVSLGMAVVLTIIYFRLSWLMRWVEKIPGISRFLSYIRVLDTFTATVLLRILSISLLRYLVFLLQYDLLFRVFDVQLNPWQVFGSISVVFLVLAIVPSIAVLSELGVRWKASVEIVRLFSSNTVGILAVSLAIWMLNLVIPALMGSLLILNIRLFRLRASRNKEKDTTGGA